MYLRVSLTGNVKHPAKKSEMNFVTPAEYHKAIAKAFAEDVDNVLTTVDLYDITHYKSEFNRGVRFVLDATATFGAYLDNGYMGGLFKNPTSPAKGVAKIAQDFRTKNGGCWFDAYDGYLSDIYRKNGFVAVASLAFNAEYAPKGWENNPTLATSPNVLFWVKAKRGVSYPEITSISDYAEGEAIVNLYK